MSMNTSKSSKTVSGHTRATKVRHLDLFCRSNHYILDLPLAIKQDADLSVGFVGNLRHLPCKFGRDDLVRRDAAARKLLDALKLIVFQPASKAVDRADKLTSEYTVIISNSAL